MPFRRDKTKTQDVPTKARRGGFVDEEAGTSSGKAGGRETTEESEPELHETLHRVERRTTLFIILVFLVAILIAAAVVLYLFLRPDPSDPDTDGNGNGTVSPPANDLCVNAIDLTQAFNGTRGYYVANTNGTTTGATSDEDCRGFKIAPGVWYLLKDRHTFNIDVCDSFQGARLSVFSGWSCSTLNCISVSGNGLTCSVKVFFEHTAEYVYVLVHGETSQAVGDFSLDMDYSIVQ